MSRSSENINMLLSLWSSHSYLDETEILQKVRMMYANRA
jgi:hypothetical protein